MSLTVFVVTQNSDLTEGRGHQRPISYWQDEKSAVDDAQGKGVMGVGPGEVEKWEFTDTGTPEYIFSKQTVYGYRKDWQGKWGYGYADNRDAPVNDPDYKEYLRLKAKFGGVA